MEIENYVVHCVNRRNPRNKSGGVCLLLKRSLYDLVNVTLCRDHCDVCTDLCNNDSTLWCVIGNILLGVVYVPPESSGYTEENIFNRLSDEIIDLCVHHSVKSVCMIGDFNARTGNVDDFLLPDESLLKNNVLAEQVNDFILAEDNFDILPKHRISEDDKTNNYGHKLIELCRNLDLRMLNGRFGPDSSRPTCKNVSVVDYALVSTNLFSNVVSCNISDFDPILSDVHSAVTFCLCTEALIGEEIEEPHIEGTVNQCNESEDKFRYVWKTDNTNEFNDVLINNDNVHDMSTLLNDMLANVNEVDHIKVNGVYDKICELFKDCAHKGNMVKSMEKKVHKGKKKPKQLNKKWFNNECKLGRKYYHQCKRRYKKSNNLNNLAQFRQSSKLYKKAMKKAIQNHDKMLNKKLKSLRSNNPKEYSKILCSGDKKDYVSKIQLDVLSEHFKQLNIDKGTYDQNEYKLAEDHCLFTNEFINNDFTSVEVKNVLSHLKNNKSAGADLILNEFLKYSNDVMCTVLTKLFNVVLNSGVVPEAWTKGIIIPIYKKKGDDTDPNNYRGISLLSCIGKVFTSLVSSRISTYVENFEILGGEQAGFRKKYSTVDHVFVLNGLIDIYSKMKKKKLYCCFVDYSKAFDMVPRVHLWQKLLSCNVNGKILTVVKNLDQSAKSAVRLNRDTGSYFNCMMGVRQGDNLSPLLFALYLNDLNHVPNYKQL